MRKYFKEKIPFSCGFPIQQTPLFHENTDKKFLPKIHTSTVTQQPNLPISQSIPPAPTTKSNKRHTIRRTTCE